nr:phospholipid carrier-dependent glycosyltransferase [Corynebacterium choanae]
MTSHTTAPAPDNAPAPLARSIATALAKPRRTLPPVTANRRETLAYVLILAIVSFTRLVALGRVTDYGTPIFDEKHYVPQAWNMVTSAQDFLTGGVELNPGFGLVVHPPLSKQLMAIGQALFGYTAFGWRISGAIAGIITVALLMLLVRRLTGQRLAGIITGVLACCDGVLLIESRFALLDIFLVTAVIVATYCLLRDRQAVTDRYQTILHTPVTAADPTGTGGTITGLPMVPAGQLGPNFGWRWWRFACGIALGCALSVKWSGLYYMAFFGIYIVAADMVLRFQAGEPRPVVTTLVKDSWKSFISLVIVPVLVYLWSFRAWFAGETTVYRHQINAGAIDDTSVLRWLPEPVASFLDYHRQVLSFHSSITSSSGHHHPWDSKPFSWLVAARPVLYYSDTDIDCAQGTCRKMIYLFGTPGIWWMTVPVVLIACYLLWRRHDTQLVLPLVGWAASFLPWVMVYDRQMYFFYAGPMVLFTIMLLAQVTTRVASWDTYQIRGKSVGKLLAASYLALVIWCFIVYVPIFYAILIPDELFDVLMFLPTWR